MTKVKKMIKNKPKSNACMVKKNQYDSLRFFLLLCKFGFVFILFIVSGCATGSISKGVEHGAVAVWNLENLSLTDGVGFDLNEMGEILSAKIIETTSETIGRMVVEREQLLLALEELNLGTTSLVDESVRLKIGKIVGAKLMVLGAYMVVETQMRLDLRLVEVETGKVLNATKKTVPAGNMTQWLNAAKIATEELFQ